MSPSPSLGLSLQVEKKEGFSYNSREEEKLEKGLYAQDFRVKIPLSSLSE